MTLQMSTEVLCIEPSYRKGMEEYLLSAICTTPSLKMLSGDGDDDDDVCTAVICSHSHELLRHHHHCQNAKINVV